jgi:hypothetical protein
MDRAFTAIECAALPKRMVYADSEDQGQVRGVLKEAGGAPWQVP